MIVTRPPSLSGKYDHFYRDDSAFMTDDEGFVEAYRLWRDSGDATHLKPFIREDQTPMVFTLMPMSFGEKAVIQELVKEHQAKTPSASDDEEDEGFTISPDSIVASCRISLRGISGLFDPDGKPVPFERSMSKNSGVRMITKKTLEWVGQVDNGALIAELGLRAFISTFAPQD